MCPVACSLFGIIAQIGTVVKGVKGLKEVQEDFYHIYGRLYGLKLYQYE